MGCSSSYSSDTGTPTPVTTSKIPPESSPALAAALAGQPLSRDLLSSLTIKELKEVVSKRGGNPDNCFEKTDLVEAAFHLLHPAGLAREGRSEWSPSPPVAESPPPEPSEQSDVEAKLANDAVSAAAVLKALQADVPSAAKVVLQYCDMATAAAAARLGRMWSELEPEIKNAASHPSLAAAIQARDVFGLIDAALELEKSGSTVAENIQHLAFEASLAEERWLVRRSIGDAVACRNPDDIELWADQARNASEDVRVEIAYAELLRWCSSNQENNQQDQSEQEFVNAPTIRGSNYFNADVGGDIGMHPLRNSSPGHEPEAICKDAPYCAGPPLRNAARSPDEYVLPKAGLPSREEFVHPSRYENFWDIKGSNHASHPNSTNAEVPSATTYVYKPGDLPKEQVIRGPRYENFWQKGRSVDGSSAGGMGSNGSYSFDAKNVPRDTCEPVYFPRYADFWNSYEKKTKTSTEQPHKRAKSQSQHNQPGRPMPSQAPTKQAGEKQQKPSPEDDATSWESVSASDNEPDEQATPEIPVKGSKIPRGPRANIPSTFRAPRGRVRLVDFLQAKACEPGVNGMRANQEQPSRAAATPTPPSKRSAPSHPQQGPERAFGKAKPESTKVPSPSKATAKPPKVAPWWFRAANAVRAGTGSKQTKRSTGARTSRQKDDACKPNAEDACRDSQDQKQADPSRAEKRRKHEQEKEENKRKEEQERADRRRRQEREFWEEQQKRQAHDQRNQQHSYRRNQGDAGRPSAGSGNPGPDPSKPASSRKGEQESSSSKSAGGSSKGASPPRAPPKPQPGSREANLVLLDFAADSEPTEEELKKAYRTMAMKWHPDRPHNRERAAEATEQFRNAKDAYEYFMDELRRKNGCI